MSTAALGGHPSGMFATLRRDRWWVEPAWTGLGFLAFSLLVTWEVFQGTHYWVGGGGHGFGGYLSPFYSPLLFTHVGVPGGAPIQETWFGVAPTWWPAWFPSASAALVMPFPLLARMTCYYYRKFYYRAYLFTPPACAVNPAPQPGRYEGERMLFLFQNLHRYAIYAAIGFIVILSYDAVQAFFRDGKPGIGVGSVILLLNPILLGTWTFGCHAWRHLVGGSKDCFSCDSRSHAAGMSGAYRRWSLVTWLNERHMLFAWISMAWVAWTGIYVRLVSMGIVHDYSTWGA